MLCFFIYAFAWTQNPHPAFRQYTVEDGLPSSEVYQIKQDSRGYIWFATGNGVSRFNGYEFENFSMNDGLPDNTVFDIFEDHKGRIWFLPFSCKLSYYYNGKIYPFKYNNELQQQLKDPIKASFNIDKEGNIFLGVRWSGIYKISEEGQITHIIDSTAAINAIQTGANDIVYASNLGKNRYKIAFNTSRIKVLSVLKDTVESFNRSNAMIKTREDDLIFAMHRKLYRLKDVDDYAITPFPRRIIWISQDNEDDLWIGTDLGGIYHIRNNNPENSSHYLPGISINGVLRDKEGGFWFASEHNGAFYMPSKYILTYDDRSGLKHSKINCMTNHGEAIYIGLPSGFVQKITAAGLTTYNCNVSGQAGNYIANLYYDTAKDALWISGKLECGVIKNKQFSINNLFGTFNDLLPISKDTYLIARSRGMFIIKDGKNLLDVRSTLFPERKRSEVIIKSGDNGILSGAADGLWKKKATDSSFSYLGNKDPLLQKRILDLAYASENLLVIATKGAGVLFYNGKEIRQISTAEGLQSNNVNKIHVDLPHIWLATDNGLGKITITKNGVWPVNNYTIADGLASNEVIDVVKAAEKIWVATNNGLSVFYPNQLRKDTVQLPIYIDKVLINENHITLREKLDLEHHQNNIKISFTGLGYKNAGKLEYRYKMQGIDTTWAHTRNREVQYPTLPPGKYSFMVSVRNAGSVWNPAAASIAFTVQKPYWQKWWFRSSLLAAFLLLTLLLVSYRISQVKARATRDSELNKTLLDLKLKALRAQMNPHFTFNVINSIQHFILYKDTESAYRYLSKFSKLVRVILYNSEKNMIPVAEEIKALELYLELEAMRFEKQFDYNIIIDPAINTKTTEIPSMLIQPYVENAIKHGILPLKEKGKITIELKKQERQLQCSIEDNGIGRDKAAEKHKKEHRSLGTKITKNRLVVINELSNSKLSEKTTDLTDKKGNPSGTRVEIFIPVK